LLSNQMEIQKIQELIQSQFPEVQISSGKQFQTVNVDKSQLHKLAAFLKSNPDTNFDYLFCESAVDYANQFEMVYHLDSTQHRHKIVIKSSIPDKVNPEIDSVVDIWVGAEYHEREIFDLFGIKFNGHPDLRKIFLDNDWVGFPLRKDYVDDINIVER
jgi:NADH-quinone oxidoreductase subunit C